jgi:hypothetical protein
VYRSLPLAYRCSNRYFTFPPFSYVCKIFLSSLIYGLLGCESQLVTPCSLVE